MATLNKKLLVNSIGVLFDLLGKTGRKEAINAAADYLGTAVYKMFRHLYRADGSKNEDFFSVPARQFMAGVATADMICTEAQYVDALAAHVKEKGNFPPMHNDALMENYPGPSPCSRLSTTPGSGSTAGWRFRTRSRARHPGRAACLPGTPGGATGTMPLNGRGGRSRDTQSIAPMSIDAFTSSEVYFFDRPEQNP